MLDGWQAKVLSGLSGWNPRGVIMDEIHYRAPKLNLCPICNAHVIDPRHWRGDDPVHVECLSELRVDTNRNEV